MSCGVGRRGGLDMALLWLWHRPAATAPIRPLAWEPPYAAGALLRNKQNKVSEPVVVSIFTKFDNHQYSFTTFSSLPLAVISYFPSSSHSWAIPLSVCMALPILDIPYKCNHVTCDLLRLTSFTQHSIFRFIQFFSMFWYFVSF